jgi:hypothetical protein
VVRDLELMLEVEAHSVELGKGIPNERKVNRSREVCE